MSEMETFFTEAFPLECRRISMSKRKQRGLFWEAFRKKSERPLFGGKEKKECTAFLSLTDINSLCSVLQNFILI